MSDKEVEGMTFLADYIVNGNTPENPEELREKISKYFGDMEAGYERKKQPGLWGSIKRIFGQGGYRYSKVAYKDKISSMSDEQLKNFWEDSSRKIVDSRSRNIKNSLFSSRESEGMLLGSLKKTNFDLWNLAKNISNSPTFLELPEDEWHSALHSLVFGEARDMKLPDISEQSQEQKELVSFFTHPAKPVTKAINETETVPHRVWDDRYVFHNLESMMKFVRKSNPAEMMAIDKFLEEMGKHRFDGNTHEQDNLPKYLMEAYAAQAKKGHVKTRQQKDNELVLPGKVYSTSLEKRSKKDIPWGKRLENGSKAGIIPTNGREGRS